MTNRNQIIRDFHAAHKRLFGLVTDLKGERFFVEKTQEMRMMHQTERMRRMGDFLTFAGHPERQFPAVHIAGTSGKGSVTMMIAQCLQAQGYQTAFHLSPYLQSPSEKLIFNDRWIPPTDFVQLIDDFYEVHGRWSQAGGEFSTLMYGEAWVAITFMWLAQLGRDKGMDWAIVETGAGGRYDMTNYLDSDVAVITNVAMDHVKTLGPELTDIAGHKAGIIKVGKPAVTGVTEADLLPIIEQEARIKEAPLYRLGHEFNYEIDADRLLTVQTPFQHFERVRVSGDGLYQLHNAALAITAADVAANSVGHLLSPTAVADGLREMTLPGRMELMPDSQLVMIDGAHNPHKMQALVGSVRDKYPDREIVAVVGGIVSKDMADMLVQLLPIVKHVVATQPFVPGKPGKSPDEVRDLVKQLSSQMSVETAGNVSQAVVAAREIASADDLILITGSIYLIGEARQIWYPVDDLLWESQQATGS